MVNIQNKLMEQEIAERVKGAQSVDEIKDILEEYGLDADEVISAAKKMGGSEADQELDMEDLEQVSGGFVVPLGAVILLALGSAFLSAGIYGIKKQKTKIEVCKKDSEGNWSDCETRYE